MPFHKHNLILVQDFQLQHRQNLNAKRNCCRLARSYIHSQTGIVSKSVHIWSYSSQYFPAFGQSECGKIRTRITPNTYTFHKVSIKQIYQLLFHLKSSEYERFSDDFRRIRSFLMSLNLLGIRSEIWPRSLTFKQKVNKFYGALFNGPE